MWQVATLRFFVAMGVGGEWGGSSLGGKGVPQSMLEHASGIFHASSGRYLDGCDRGIAVGTQWRLAYLIGVIPALLVVWVRAKVKEPEGWKDAQRPRTGGKLLDLFGDAVGGNTHTGIALAAVGLASFWAVGVATQGLAKNMLLRV